MRALRSEPASGLAFPWRVRHDSQKSAPCVGAEGGDPFEGEPAQVNTEGFLAGGRAFGPVISDNITPDEDGLPAGLTFAEFRTLMRTGHEPGEDEILQVMPWPVFRNMSDHDLLAIYTYLRSIPHREGG